MQDVFGAADFSTVLSAITALMVVGVGIALAFKGGDLGKRAIEATCGDNDGHNPIEDEEDPEDYDHWRDE